MHPRDFILHVQVRIEGQERRTYRILRSEGKMSQPKGHETIKHFRVISRDSKVYRHYTIKALETLQTSYQLILGYLYRI